MYELLAYNRISEKHKEMQLQRILFAMKTEAFGLGIIVQYMKSLPEFDDLNDNNIDTNEIEFVNDFGSAMKMSILSVDKINFDASIFLKYVDIENINHLKLIINNEKYEPNFDYKIYNNKLSLSKNTVYSLLLTHPNDKGKHIKRFFIKAMDLLEDSLNFNNKLLETYEGLKLNNDELLIENTKLKKEVINKEQKIKILVIQDEENKNRINNFLAKIKISGENIIDNNVYGYMIIKKNGARCKIKDVCKKIKDMQILPSKKLTNKEILKDLHKKINFTETDDYINDYILIK